MGKEHICEKARGKLWMLRRMNKLNLDIHQMFDVYIKEVRSVLELAVPVWHPGLTQKQSEDIERIQKVAFKIILHTDYANYHTACKVYEAQTLELRREKLCLNIARKNLKSDKTFFTKITNPVNTRSKKVLVKEFKCNNGRFQKTSLPYMAKLLNNQNY